MHLGITLHHGQRKSHEHIGIIDRLIDTPSNHVLRPYASCVDKLQAIHHSQKEHIPSLHALMVCKLCNAAKIRG